MAITSAGTFEMKAPPGANSFYNKNEGSKDSAVSLEKKMKKKLKKSKLKTKMSPASKMHFLW